MFQILDRIQYSLIYMLYKTRYYKSGKGYIYRANQIITVIGTMTASLLFLVFTNVNLKSYAMLAFFGLTLAIIFFFFERNISKPKLMQHRPTYKKRRKYLIPFYIFSAIVLVLFGFLNYWRS